MKYIAALLLTFPLLATAQTEADLSCQLAQQQGELSASLLESPKVFGSVGDPSSGDENLIMGLSQSLAGRNRAKIVRELADVKCESIRTTLHLEQIGATAIANIKQDADNAELDML